MAESWTLFLCFYYKKTLLKSVIHNSRTPLVRKVAHSKECFGLMSIFANQVNKQQIEYVLTIEKKIFCEAEIILFIMRCP
jgi:hypothetical protein